MEAKEIILKWVALFNEGNAQKITELYHVDAVNHQVANDPVEGKEAIFNMFKSEFSQTEMKCVIEEIYQDGPWCILEWKDPLGLRGCGFFQIEEDKIKLQRGYWDKLSFLRMHNLPIPKS